MSWAAYNKTQPPPLQQLPRPGHRLATLPVPSLNPTSQSHVGHSQGRRSPLSRLLQIWFYRVDRNGLPFWRSESKERLMTRCLYTLDAKRARACSGRPPQRPDKALNWIRITPNWTSETANHITFHAPTSHPTHTLRRNLRRGFSGKRNIFHVWTTSLGSSIQSNPRLTSRKFFQNAHDSIGDETEKWSYNYYLNASLIPHNGNISIVKTRPVLKQSEYWIRL